MWSIFGTFDRPSPSDIFKNDRTIELFTTQSVYFDTTRGEWRLHRELLRIPFTEDPKVWICPIPGTGSMDPLFDKEHMNMYLAGINAEEQKIMVDWLAREWLELKRANILVYLSENRYTYAVHRLKKITRDKKGRLWWFKGDNNFFSDPYPARDEGIWFLNALTAF